jgi:hypothetical protein
MSYCRQSSTSDLYIYCFNDDDPKNPGFDCSSCPFTAKDELFYGVEAIINHIQRHIDAGHKVENDVIPLIKADSP